MRIVQIMKHAVASDREGNFDLYAELCRTQYLCLRSLTV